MKEPADGLLRYDAEDDQRDARRDEDAEGADGGDDARGELPGVTEAVHLRDCHAGEGGGRSRREPQMALKTVAPATVAIASPPGIWPMNLWAESKSFFAMPR